MRTRPILAAWGMLWLLAVGTGLHIMTAYDNTPGLAAAAPVRWPAASQLRRAPDGATLIMLAHPRCPCTRASIGELNSLMARCQGKLAVYVLFFKPAGFARDWEKTDLWRSAAAIPGVTVRCDESGVEARHFGVATSGQTLLFDSAGHLMFSGGITGARGHSGDNPGSDAVISLVNTGTADIHRTLVFGCSLYDPGTLRKGVQ